MFTMKILTASLVLCTVLTISQAGSMKPNTTWLEKTDGWPSGSSSPHASCLCANKRQHCTNLIGSFCPQCDSNGNFLPQQCWASTGYCWCVNIYTGKEIPNTKTPPGVTPINCETASYCPDGWVPFGQKCFIFISSPKSWTEAQFYCQFEGANLASIHSEEENHFVQSLTREDTHDFPESWLGGIDAIHPGHWLWIDGSKFNYEDFYDDDYRENEMDMGNCLKMNCHHDLKWSPEACNETFPFVCSKNM